MARHSRDSGYLHVLRTATRFGISNSGHDLLHSYFDLGSRRWCPSAMSRFRVFTGAPKRMDLDEASTGKTYRWQTIPSQSVPRQSQPWYTLPPATMASANRRISLLYENIIFQDDSDAEAAFGNEGLKDGPDDPATVGAGRKILFMATRYKLIATTSQTKPRLSHGLPLLRKRRPCLDYNM